MSCNKIGPQSFQALSCHGELLIELKLNTLQPDIIPKVSQLKCCTNLVSLSLGGIGARWANFDLEEEHNDAFLEMVAWLKECKQLRTLAFTNFPSAIALMALILLENSIHLTSLEYLGFRLLYTEEFLLALANQTSLQFLTLEEQEEIGYWDLVWVDSLVESLSKLVNLTELYVSEMFASFTDLQILRLASGLPKLEVWVTSGDGLTDDIWSAVASLRSLRRLVFGAATHFTPHGILDFVEQLGLGNKGLVLHVNSPPSKFSRKEQKLIQEKFTKKVEGEFKIISNRGKYLHD